MTTTSSASSTLGVTITGLPSGVSANVLVTGPGGFSQQISTSTTLKNLTPGTYTITASTVEDPSLPSLGGTLSTTTHLARYPWHKAITVDVNGTTAAGSVYYPDPVITVEIPDASSSSKVPMDFVLVPGGTYTMGSAEQGPSSGPGYGQAPHSVTIANAFYVAKYPTTQAQWVALMQANPSNFTGDMTRPVDQVSWDAITTFVSALDVALPGHAFRLPSEAELEYAIRGGTSTEFFFGSTAANATLYGWPSDTTTHPVGKKSPNPWGLYDVIGNVCQWTLDDWSITYGSPQPVDGSAWVASPRTTQRVFRGSAYYYNAEFCRSAVRHFSYTTDETHPYLGFRLVAPVQ